MPDLAEKDYYQILQVSSAAHPDTIETMFRHFVQRYHPDNGRTGDRDIFELIIEAHEVLKDEVSRASYDLRLRQSQESQGHLLDGLLGGDAYESDGNIQSGMLAAFYFKCRADPGKPGLSQFDLMKLYDIPRELMAFHIWYLKGKGWIERTDDGLFAITVEGVDQAIEANSDNPPPSRIEDQSAKTIHL